MGRRSKAERRERRRAVFKKIGGFLKKAFVSWWLSGGKEKAIAKGKETLTRIKNRRNR